MTEEIPEFQKCTSSKCISPLYLNLKGGKHNTYKKRSTELNHDTLSLPLQVKSIHRMCNFLLYLQLNRQFIGHATVRS